MEMTESAIRPLYFRYLLAAFGSALVGAVYTLVDMAVIGQYAGPTGTAAIALVLPVWSFVCSLGILTGIGGSVLYSNAKGESGTGRAKMVCSRRRSLPRHCWRFVRGCLCSSAMRPFCVSWGRKASFSRSALCISSL